MKTILNNLIGHVLIDRLEYLGKRKAIITMDGVQKIQKLKDLLDSFRRHGYIMYIDDYTSNGLQTKATISLSSQSKPLYENNTN